MLVRKLKQIKVPNSIINWVIDQLPLRQIPESQTQQRLFSEWGNVPSRVPQGTKLRHWIFLLMINDLSVPSIFNMWKYVDDTTVSETLPKGQQSKAQDLVRT